MREYERHLRSGAIMICLSPSLFKRKTQKIHLTHLLFIVFIVATFLIVGTMDYEEEMRMHAENADDREVRQ